MILKINLYLETDLKLTPEEVAGAASLIQKTLTQELLDYQEGEPLRFRIKAEGSKTEFKLLTKEEVENRVLGSQKKKEGNLQQGHRNSPDPSDRRTN